MVLEKTLENPLDCKEIKPINPKGNQPWMFIGKTDAEAPILWPPNVKSQVIGKDSDDGKDWRQMEKEETMRYLESITNSLNTNLRKPHEIGRQRSWVYYSPWGHKELDWLSDWTTLIISDIWLNNFLSMNKKTCYALQVFYLSVRLTVQFFSLYSKSELTLNISDDEH